MQLLKEFRSSGANKSMQDKIVRDFQSIMKKVVETTKETRVLLPQHQRSAPYIGLIFLSPQRRCVKNTPSPVAGAPCFVFLFLSSDLCRPCLLCPERWAVAEAEMALHSTSPSVEATI